MEASLNGFPAVKPAVNEEAPRPAAPTAAAVSPVPDQVSRVDIPPPTAPEPKPDPVPPPAPAKAPAENGPAAAPAAASLRETPPPDPKPVPVDLETQPKIRAVVLAEIVKKVQAQYPIIARSQRVSGQVDVEAEINDKGDVVQARAVSGPILLRNAAEEAVRKWKYKPASIGGVNVSSKARVTVNFNLQ